MQQEETLNQKTPTQGKTISLASILAVAVILILLAGIGFLGVKYSTTQQEIETVKIALAEQKANAKVINFTKLFIGKVLQTETIVDFETRLQLENAVRDLNDDEIFSLWNQFVGNVDEANAQKLVKDLLEMLVNKIK